MKRLKDIALYAFMHVAFIAIMVGIKAACLFFDVYEYLRAKVKGPRPTIQNGGIK